MGTRADTFFGGMDKEISEKRNFFVYHSVPKNFQGENFPGQVPRNPYALRIQKQGVQQIFYPVCVARSQARAAKCDPLAKI